MQFSTISLIQFRHKETSLRKEDCIAIDHLCTSGFTLQQSLEILREKKNEEIFQIITTKLQRGESLNQFFIEICPHEYQIFLAGFLQYMPLEEALSISLSLASQAEIEKKELVKGMLYPTMLLLGMMSGMYLFTTFVLPAMLSLLSGFHMSTINYTFLQSIIQLLSIVFLIMAFLCIIFTIYALSPSHIVQSYQFLSKKHNRSILVQYASSQFARFFVECHRRKISTNQTLAILQEIKHQPLVQYIAKEMNQSLVQGTTILEAVQHTHVEASLIRFFKIATVSSTTDEMIDGYLKMVKERTTMQIRKFSYEVQIVSYSFVGAVLIFVYRILLIPMQMLQNF